MDIFRINYVLVIVAISYLCTSMYIESFTTTSNLGVFAQNTSSSASSNIRITKDLTNSYTISSGSSQIGSFDTKYTITGYTDAIKKEQKLIVSTISSDFNSSPVIGYIKTSGGEVGASNQQQKTTLPNPFADKTAINQKISTEINNSIASASTSNIAKTFIQCDFGMSISQWTCKSHGLIG